MLRPWISIAFLGVFFSVLFGLSRVMAVNFAAKWQYFDTSEDKARLSQNYALILSSWVTSALSTGFSLRYTRQDQGGRWRELYTPVFYANLINDWFTFNLSATASENRRSEGADISSRSWDANLTTQYRNYNWRLYYGESSQEDDQDPKRINSDSKHWGASVSKDWNVFSIFGDYRGTSSKDKVEKSKTDTDTYFLKGKINSSWRKLTYSFSQQINYMKTDWRTSQKLTRGKILLNVIIDWHLQDNNEIKTNDYFIIDIEGQIIDLVVFYKNANTLEEIDNNVKWKIEWSNDGVTWNLIAENISLPYEFSSSLSGKKYVKFTVISGSDELVSPLVRVYRYLPIGVTSYSFDSTTLRSDISLLYSFDEKKNIAYNFSYNKNLPDPGKNSWTKNHSLSGYWWINKLLQTSLNLTMNADKIQGQKTKKNYNISVNIFSEILDTLTSNTTFTHSLNKEGGKKISEIDNIIYSITAEIYPDLELRWDINYGHTKNYDQKATIDSISTHINITAQLRPSLTVNGIYDYSYSKNKGQITNTNTDQFVNINVTWRPSEVFLIRGTEAVKWGSNQKTTLNSDYSLWVNINPKIQTNFTYSGTRAKGQNSDRFSGSLSWSISRYLFFRNNYSWQKTQGEKEWSILFSLSLTF
ncbi:MAG TPA: hypothetical protein ENJ96_09885 [Thermodesulfatator atlanticus]|uniref:Uncharacterized protein n=1 Tax=Thermodesulfatator atlanticus TaxID=501497 RepID=A0A7V5P1G1_9BACT|nr:hypothetical protein [Thermodesulfatator atlanticus]